LTEEEEEEKKEKEQDEKKTGSSEVKEETAAGQSKQLDSSSSVSSSLSSAERPTALPLLPSLSFPSPFIVGTASWSIPRASAPHFPTAGSHLARYSSLLTGVEINSSFYRHHQPSTYRKWAATTPRGFRFAVKLHKDFTHTQRLAVKADELRSVIEGVKELGDRLAVLLIQLPPSLAFDRTTAQSFFSAVRAVWSGAVVVEPRHTSWAADDATEVLSSASVGRVIADPERCPAAVVASAPLVYYRLHGSPVVYKSEYSAAVLDEWVGRMRAERMAGRAVWCSFDNTALGAATENALYVLSRVNAT